MKVNFQPFQRTSGINLKACVAGDIIRTKAKQEGKVLAREPWIQEENGDFYLAAFLLVLVAPPPKRCLHANNTAIYASYNTKGAFFWDYSGIGLLRIDSIDVLLGTI